MRNMRKENENMIIIKDFFKKISLPLPGRRARNSIHLGFGKMLGSLKS